MRFMRFRRKITCAIVLVAIAAIYFSLSFVFKDILIESISSPVGLSKDVIDKYNLKLYCSFDHSVLWDEVNVIELESHYVKYTEGKFGGSRQFEHGYNGKIILNYSWEKIVNEHQTISFFFKQHKSEKPQTILFFPSRSSVDNVLALENNKIILRIGSLKGENSVSYQLPQKDQWHHVALSFKENNVCLFVNGSCIGELPFDASSKDIKSWVMFGGKEELPFLGSIDELTIFASGSPEQLVKKFSGGIIDSPLSSHKSAKAYAKQASSNVASVLCVGVRSLSRLNPMRYFELMDSHSFPIVSFDFSKSDDKHFKIAHEISLLSGERTIAACNMRKVRIAMGHEIVEGFVYLDDVYGNKLVKPHRPAYVVIIPEDVKADKLVPKRMFCLTPPELYSVKHPDADSLLPTDCSKLVKFYLNNELKGIYYWQEWQSKGRGWMISDKASNRVIANSSDQHSNVTLFSDRILSMSHSGETIFKVDAERAKNYILSDVFFPWSGMEVAAREEIHKENQKKMGFTGGGIHEFDFLGENTSAFMLKKSLQIPEGVKIIESSNPDLIGLDGHVFADKVSKPTYVNVTVEHNSLKKELKFRLVPAAPELTTLDLWIDSPLQKITKQDFLCSIQHAGQTNSILNYGLVGRHSGIKHRGNTSYVRARKRSIVIEFENPHNVVGDARSRHLVLLSGYSDKTRLRNAFTFDKFREMNPTVNCAPNLTYVELCVNGEYAGIYEAINRIDDLNLSTNIVSAIRVRSGNNLFGTTNIGGFEEIVPRGNFARGTTNYVELVKYLNTTNSVEFYSRVKEKVVVENLADFYLMLNFSQNVDLVHVNQILCFDKDGRLSIVPWDCDKSFHDRNHFTGLSNSLISRCLKQSPEFCALVKERWAMHRETIFSDEAIEQWISEKTGLISEYMDYELENISISLQGEEDMSYAESVEDFRKTIYFLREKLDEHINSL